MNKTVSKFALAASISLALALALSCSVEWEEDGNGISSSSNGGGGNSSGGDNSSGSGNKNVPTNVTAEAVSSNSITISWNAVTGASGYYVYIAESSSGPYTELGYAGSALSYTSRNLATATTFYYKVKANNGELSDPVSATTLLTAPSGVKAESLTSSSITITWNDFANATAYRIYRSESSSGTYAEIGTSTSNSYTDTELAPNTRYYYIVSVRNNTLEGDGSSSVSATVLLHAPTNVTAKAASSNSITISWNAVTSASSYEVYRAESSSGLYTRIVNGTSSLSYTNSNLATATTFYYKVKAANGQLSDSVSTTTLLTAPSGVKAESLTSSSITITWNDFANATAYRIYRSESYSGTYAEIGTSTSNSYTDTELASNANYYYKVSVRNNTLEGDQSSYVNATVLLRAPTSVTAEAVSSNSITISWNAVTFASGYYVYIAESSSGPYTELGYAGSALSYTSRNLATATTFYYKVKARDGQLSDPVSATTL
ncbi:MAG: fibronectin type III domain-containing protein [Candidatus Fibromonas sp.]|jgi:fibronectin type 3 domain-containing protein|nr:fibronectin type III domain-containing protein [Candidatus Fibromonas sp.]